MSCHSLVGYHNSIGYLDPALCLLVTLDIGLLDMQVTRHDVPFWPALLKHPPTDPREIIELSLSVAMSNYAIRNETSIGSQVNKTINSLKFSK